ncbi:MAG TPA: hypothetical protein PLE25_13320 [Spirochaetales bacterium]|nr:hypothetical protein [Spirochaetales bacterium]
MYGAMKDELTAKLAAIRDEGLYKDERVITTPQGALVSVKGGKGPWGVVMTRSSL